MCVLGRHDDGGLGAVGGLLMHGRGEGRVMTMRAGSYVCVWSKRDMSTTVLGVCAPWGIRVECVRWSGAFSKSKLYTRVSQSQTP